MNEEKNKTDVAKESVQDARKRCENKIIKFVTKLKSMQGIEFGAVIAENFEYFEEHSRMTNTVALLYSSLVKHSAGFGVDMQNKLAVISKNVMGINLSVDGTSGIVKHNYTPKAYKAVDDLDRAKYYAMLKTGKVDQLYQLFIDTAKKGKEARKGQEVEPSVSKKVSTYTKAVTKQLKNFRELQGNLSDEEKKTVAAELRKVITEFNAALDGIEQAESKLSNLMTHKKAS